MRTIFLFTHIGSENKLLYESISENPRISSIGQTGIAYGHPLQLEMLKNKIVSKKGRLYPGYYLFDEIVYNHQFACDSLLENSYNIILFSKPEIALPEIAKHMEAAMEYYFFRLRRLCEIANQHKCLVIESSELTRQSTYDKISEFLSLNNPLKMPETTIENKEPSSSVKYQKYQSFLLAHGV